MPEPTEVTAEERGPYVVDYCHGMVGGPAVIGPTGVFGFMQGRENDAKAEALCEKLNIGWSVLGRTIEHLREKRTELEASLLGVTATCEGHKLEQTRLTEAAEARLREVEETLRNAQEAAVTLAAEKSAVEAERDRLKAHLRDRHKCPVAACPDR